MIQQITWCETCGNEVSPEGKCVCWCLLAGALQQFLGMDFDASADMAARMWDAEADREFVWAAKYADDHEVETYPAPGQWRLSGDDYTDALDAAENAFTQSQNDGAAADTVAAFEALHTKLGNVNHLLDRQDMLTLAEALRLSVDTCDPRCADDVAPWRGFADRLVRIVDTGATPADVTR